MKDRQEDIKNYLRNDQKGKEANRLEREALSDSFLCEALEGLTAVDGEHLKVIESLNRKMSKIRVHSERRIGNYWWIVAAFLIVAGMAWKLLYVPTDESVKLVAVPQEENDSVMVSVEIRETKLLDTVGVSGVIEDISEVGVVVLKSENVRKVSADSLVVLAELEKSEIDSGQVFFKVSRLKKEIHQEVLDSGMILLKDYKTVGFLQKAEIVKLRGVERFEERKDWRVAFNRYVRDSLSFPEEAVVERVEGAVVLSLNFNRKGKLSRIKIIRKLHPACDREAVRLVKEYSGSWGINEKNVMVTLPFYLK